jgi:hypothetical protein
MVSLFLPRYCPHSTVFPLNSLPSCRLFPVILLLGTAWGSLCAAEPAATPANKRVKVLLVTGIEFHNWRETAPQIAKQLTSCPEIEVKLETNFNVLCSDDIFKYDVLFFDFWNSKDDSPSLDDDLALSNIGNSLIAEKESSSTIWQSVFSRPTGTALRRSLGESMTVPCHRMILSASSKSTLPRAIIRS